MHSKYANKTSDLSKSINYQLEHFTLSIKKIYDSIDT